MNGILLLNKPQNMTSHDCVNQVRKLFHTKKVGHLGTLDPDVTGVLPICINNATKIIQFIENTTKEYIAEVSIGKSTSTEDASGEIIKINNQTKTITKEQLISILNSFVGEQIQIPPMISSVKINGKKLYEYARKNIEVERPKRIVHFYEIELLSSDEVFYGEEINFSVRILCSKGTYIRTLAVDIGEKLGYPSHMKSLVRSKSGPYNLNQCFTFEEIKQGDFKLISIFDALRIYKMIEVNDEQKQRILNGQKLEKIVGEYTLIVFYDKFKNVLAVYAKDPKNEELLKPVRVFNVS